MLVLTWNLFHGRSEPETRRDLLPDFSAMLAGFDWDVALLQECPPWWPAALGRASGASARSVRTSRNFLLPLRRLIAQPRPDLLKSNGGGCNAILVRGQAIAEHRRAVLRRRPERRTAHGVRLADGTWITNLHAQAHDEERARADVALAARFTEMWAPGAPAVLGGDFNLRRVEAPGFTVVASRDVDHVLVRGLRAAAPGRRLGHGTLSDHPPLAVEVV